MSDRDEKHCGRLTDHEEHNWKGHGQTERLTLKPGGHTTLYPPRRWIGPRYRCTGRIVVEGGHW